MSVNYHYYRPRKKVKTTHEMSESETIKRDINLVHDIIHHAMTLMDSVSELRRNLEEKLRLLRQLEGNEEESDLFSTTSTVSTNSKFLDDVNSI